MKHLVIIACFCTILSAQQSPSEWWADASQAQRDSIRASYEWGKPYDLGLTYAAYDWHESGGGLWPINLANLEFGRYHQRVYFLAKDIYGREPTKWEQSRIAEKLLSNLEWERQQVLARLQKEREKNGDDWLATWNSWNSGNGKHAEEIRDKVRFLRSLGWK